MYKLLFVVVFASFITACRQTYYVVRHAEKASTGASMGSSDVPLTEAGKQRAERLRELLAAKKIKHIYSTNTIRTRSTAQPTADLFKLNIEIYGPKPDSGFYHLLKSLKGNTLVVGHSNTVDDIVNGLTGIISIPKDLDDAEYDNLFIVKKAGRKYRFEILKF